MKKLFILLLPAIILFSCSKDPDVVVDYSVPEVEVPIQFFGPFSWKCSYAQSLSDYATIMDSLSGEWEWTYVEHYWTPQDNNGQVHQGWKVVFTNDGDLYHIDPPQGITSDTIAWNVVLNPFTDGYWLEDSLFQIPYQLYGNIHFCNDNLQFEATFMDLENNYFRRVQ